MSSCVWIPNDYFSDVQAVTGNREITKQFYNVTNNEIFLQANKEIIQFHEDGSPTLQSVLQVPEVKGVLKDLGVIAAETAGLDLTKEYRSITEPLNEVMEFNEKNPLYIASIQRTSTGNYTLGVEYRTLQNEATVDKIRTNYEVNKKILSVLNALGFRVELDTPHAKHHGIFNPYFNTETTESGIKAIIKIADSEEGWGMLSEEMAHTIIAGMQDTPHIVRALAMVTEEVMREVLGDQYETYKTLYAGRTQESQMKLETLGHILDGIIHEKAEVKATAPKTILDRIRLFMNWFKNIAKRLKESSVEKDINEIRDIMTASKAAEVVWGKYTDLINVNEVFTKETLYAAFETTKDSLTRFMNLLIQREALSKRNTMRDEFFNEAIITPYQEAKLKDPKNYSTFILNSFKGLYMGATNAQEVINKMNSGKYFFTINPESPNKKFQIETIKTVRNIKNEIETFKPMIEILAKLVEDPDLGFSKEEIAQIQEVAIKLNDLYVSLQLEIGVICGNVIYNFFMPFFARYASTEEVDVGAEEALKLALTKSGQDISYISRWLDSMAESGNLMLDLFDQAYKHQQFVINQRMTRALHRIDALHNKYYNETGSRDTSFIHDSNDPRFYVGDRDYASYNQQKEAKRQELMEKYKDSETTTKHIYGFDYDKVDQELYKWEKKHTKPDPITGERIPLESEFPKTMHLTGAQLDYYLAFMDIKEEIDNYLPLHMRDKHRAVQISKTATEAILNSKSLEESAGAVKYRVKHIFKKRKDETDFGVIHSKLNYNKEEIRELPIFFVDLLEDPSQISTDSTNALRNYAMMAIKYEGMNQIIDTMELAKDWMKVNHTVQNTKNGNILKQLLRVGNQTLESTAEIPYTQSKIAQRLEDFFTMQMYGRYKKDEAIAKGVDMVKQFTSWTTMGMNLFSGLNNVGVGKLQMILEAVAGEYFGAKDIVTGDLNYFSMITEGLLLSASGSTKNLSKVELIRQKFNVVMDLESEEGFEEFYRSNIGRVFGKASVYFMTSMGEHYMSTRTLLAFMNTVKLKNKDGHECSLFDALEVFKYKYEEQSDGTVKKVRVTNNSDAIDGELRIKEGYTKLDGSEFSLDEHNAEFEFIISKVNAINKSLHGIYNKADMSAFQQTAMGRATIMFRKWMVPHYNRRFKKAYYNLEKQQMVEGFYRTLIREWKERGFKELVRIIATGNKDDKLTMAQFANLKRAMAEITMFIILSGLCSFMGDYKDKDTWASRLLLYQLKRLHMEVGVSFWPPSMVMEGMTILQSPTALLSPMTDFIKLLQIQAIFDTDSKGNNVYLKNLTRAIPIWKNIKKIVDLRDQDYLFYIFRPGYR